MSAQSLEQVTAAFAIWRSKRSGPRSHTPKELQHQAVALLSDHSVRTILDALKISRECLNRWQEQLNSPPSSSAAVIPDKARFAVLPSSPPTTTAQAPFVIEYPNGIRLHLQGEPSTRLLSFVLASLPPLGE